jgi:hypothetical protein
MSKFIKICDSTKEKLINVSTIDTITRLNGDVLDNFDIPKDEQNSYFALEIKTKDETHYGTISTKNWFSFIESVT